MRHLIWLSLSACASDVVHDHFNVLVDGAVLPVEVHGDLASGTLVLVESGGPSGPGIAERTVGYHPYQDTLERDVAVAWYDRRGTGNATGDYGVDDQSIDQLIIDLDAVIDVLIARYAPDHVLLLGHSFGTYTSGLYLLDRPGKVDGWVAAGPSIIEGPDDLFVPYRRDFACRVGDGQRADGRTDPLWADLAAFCEANPTLPPLWDTPEREELWVYLNEIQDLLEPWPAMDVGGLLGSIVGSHYNLIDTQLRDNLISSHIDGVPGREDLIPELGALEVPVGVITGEFDGTTPTELGAAMIGTLPAGAALTEMPDAGHYMMTDDPEAFRDAVMRVVDQM
jgi:pimeloyl-ACP methyl ester carboxylesterase